jgi:hypothetical protein
MDPVAAREVKEWFSGTGSSRMQPATLRVAADPLTKMKTQRRGQESR